MKVTLMPGVASISGSFKSKNGKKLVFKTYNRKGCKPETRAYFMERNERKSAPTEKECAQRKRMADAAAYLYNLSDEQKKAYHEAWLAGGYMFEGKKYVTLRGYIMARCMKNKTLD